MNTFVKRLLAVSATSAMILGATGISMASPPPGAMRPGRPMGGNMNAMGAQMAQRLHLSTAQQKKANQISQRYAPMMMQDFQKLQTTRDPGTRQKTMMHVQAIGTKMQSEFEKILNPTQKKQFRQMVQEQRARMMQMQQMQRQQGHAPSNMRPRH